VLTVCIVGTYVIIVGYLGALFRTGGDLAISLVATGIVAVLFAPLRDRLQRGVNRLMYGERDDPYAVLSRLGQRLEATLEPHAMLPAVAESVAHALKLPHVAIELKRGEEYETAAEYGWPAGEPLRLPLVYGTETVGRIVLSPRAPGESFGPADRRLLDDLARQAGVAAHAVRLTNDLQRSRERLVTAREEERRRLRRNLHDGLGPALSSAMLKLGAARRLLPPDSLVDDLIVEVRDDMRATIADVRGLVYDLRPPALDQLGLELAIRDYAEQCASEDVDGMHVTVDAPEQLSPLPAAVEVAVYQIAREALTNAARHARARSCRVHLALQDGPERVELRLEITDDGVGLPDERHLGVGLSSMRERAEELGGKFSVESPPEGGTRVVARLPVGKE
jgi:signal transduction histidine kinase